MADRTVDIIVIGLGPGGEDAAGRLAESGLSVLGIDSHLVGGECPYWGCVPSKMMVRAADALAEARRVDGLAGAVGDVRSDWTPVARRIREDATDDWDDRVAVERFTGKGGTFVRGHGRLVSRTEVEVDGQRYEARRGIVVATGSAPAVPPIDGLGDIEYWTNHQLVEAEELPESLLVLGGGAIGCELSQVAARFGVRVTVVEAADRLLAMEEPAAGDLVAEVLRQDGVDVRLGVSARRVAGDGPGGQARVELSDGSSVGADRVLVATGRRVDVHAAGLDVLGLPGLDAEARAVPVDEWCRVTDGVWAVGDVTGKGAFTHTSMYQADVVVRDILGLGGPPATYEAMPRVTFTDPEVGAVGLTEARAREQYADVRVGTTQVSTTARGWIHGPGNAGFITVVEDAGRGVLVGATSAGPAGGEVLGLLSLAVHAAVPVATLRSMIYAYPTFHRGVQDALRALGAGATAIR
jgi:pyruvate/2-oxoglutarate dehydrogenase complex dihydrolipoamide dehydrogenase (E3) component